MAGDLIKDSQKLAERLEKTGHYQDAEIVRGLLIHLGVGIEGKAVVQRARKTQDIGDWPPNLNQDEIEALIDQKCGCRGRFDCDCVSVFNKARVEAWTTYNSQSGPRR